MAYTKEFNVNTPLGSESPKQGDDRIRDHKYAIMERLAREHHFADQDGSEYTPPSPTGEIGLHKKVTLMERSGDQTTAANQGAIYAKAVSGVTELFMRGESNATIRQITYGGMQSFDIPKDEIIVFEKDTSVVGYTLQTDKNDMVLFITKGSGAGGESGGSDKTGGTWTVGGLTTNIATHAITESEMPSHKHQINCRAGEAYPTGTYSYMCYANGINTAPNLYITNSIGTTGGGNAHGHSGSTVSQNGTWRPSGRNFTRQKRS